MKSKKTMKKHPDSTLVQEEDYLVGVEEEIAEKRDGRNNVLFEV